MIFKNKDDAIIKLKSALQKEALNTKPSMERLSTDLGFYDRSSLAKSMDRFNIGITMLAPPYFDIKEKGLK